MNWRLVIGVIAGFALWWLLFFAIGTAFGAAWPDYREAARLMFEGDLSGFRTPMLFLNFVLFAVSGLAVGWLAAWLGRNRLPALVLTALFLVYMGINHYVLVWDQLPHWYNVIVPLVIAGSVALGSLLVTRHRSATS